MTKEEALSDYQSKFIGEHYSLLNIFDFLGNEYIQSNDKQHYLHQYSIFNFIGNENLLEFDFKIITILNIFALIALIVSFILNYSDITNFILYWILGNLLLYFFYYLFNINNIKTEETKKINVISKIIIELYCFLNKKTFLLRRLRRFFLSLIIFGTILTGGSGLIILSESNNTGDQAENPNAILFKIIMGIGIFILSLTLIIIAIFISSIVSFNQGGSYCDYITNYFNNEDQTPSFMKRLFLSISSDKSSEEPSKKLIKFIKFFKMAFVFLIIIAISCLGIPFYLFAFSLTSMYIFIDLLYKFFIYPIIKVNKLFVPILRDRGRLLTLIFCSLVILSIQKSAIFGSETPTIVVWMSFVFGIIIILNIYDILKPNPP